MKVATITSAIHSATAAMLLLGSSTHAWSLQPPTTPSTKSHSKKGVLLSRAEVFQQTFTATAAAFTVGLAWTASAAPATAASDTTTTVTPSGVTVQIIKQGDGPKPDIGELIAIRFAAYVSSTGNKIDDIFDSPEPYYTRLGSGGLLKGVETTLPLMRLGDRWKLTIPVRNRLLHVGLICTLTRTGGIHNTHRYHTTLTPPTSVRLAQGELAFGSKGRPASAGKPRIPGDAEIIFEVEVVGLPGKEPELIDLIGDD